MNIFFGTDQMQLLINGIFVGLGTSIGSLLLMSFFIKLFKKRLGDIWKSDAEKKKKLRK
jgi:hypothetical protein